jgi:hypothetical protein
MLSPSFFNPEALVRFTLEDLMGLSSRRRTRLADRRSLKQGAWSNRRNVEPAKAKSDWTCCRTMRHRTLGVTGTILVPSAIRSSEGCVMLESRWTPGRGNIDATESN